MNRPRIRFLALALALAALLAGCSSGPATRADRTVRIALGHLRFAPDALTVKAGSTVQFVLVNADSIDHEFVIGSEQVQKDHASAAAGGGGHGGASDNRAAVEASKTVKFTYTFDKPGTLIFGCHINGHYAGGMKGTIEVTT